LIERLFGLGSNIAMLHGKQDTDALESGFELSITNEQTAHTIEPRRLVDVARRILVDSKFTSASISIAVVDDATIHGLNRKFLDHDYPTDVLSFVLEATESHLKGEVVLSADTAAMVASAGGWDATDEHLLYVIHGLLHLIGLDDQTDDDAARMRAAEHYYLSEFGVELPQDLDWDEADSIAAGDDPAGGGGTQAW
jgi:probable rRNA maturation factor